MLVAIATVSTGVATVIAPSAAVAIACLVPTGLLALTPRGRLLLFCVGLMTVFGREGGINPTKLAFLVFAVTSALISLSRLLRSSPDTLEEGRRTLLAGIAALGVAIVLAMSVGVAKGADLQNVARDAVTYVLIVAGLLIGVDAGMSARDRAFRFLPVLVSALAAISFSLQTSYARGISLLSEQGLVLGSTALIAVGVSWSAAEALGGDRIKAGWLAVAGALIAIVLLSGTRTGLLLMVCLAAGFLVKGRAKVELLSRTFVVSVLFATAMVYVVSVLGPLVVQGDFLAARFESVGSVLRGDLRSDASARARLGNYAIAEEYAHDAPIEGQGFGRISHYGFGIRSEDASFYLDTPLLYPAKFGSLGSVTLFGGFALIVSGLVRIADPRSTARAAVLAFALFCLAVLPLSAITEDKGFSLSCALLAALSIGARRWREEGLQ